MDGVKIAIMLAALVALVMLYSAQQRESEEYRRQLESDLMTQESLTATAWAR